MMMMMIKMMMMMMLIIKKMMMMMMVKPRSYVSPRVKTRYVTGRSRDAEE